MKNLDRLSIIDSIGRELQSRMSYTDINTYLEGFGVNTSKETSGVNSKWVYVKELLANIQDDTILRIADELGIPHGYTVTPSQEIMKNRLWEPNHFRLFISHLSSYKKQVAELQRALRVYSVSAFVAHVDIEPAKEWQDEIEAGLYSMDALAAILMPGFKESNWTDQEVGVAIGRGILVIPIIKGMNPYGFIGKFQGLNSQRKTVGQVAQGIFDILITSANTNNRMFSCLIDTTVQASSEAGVLSKLSIIENIRDFPTAYLERLREGALKSHIFTESDRSFVALNKLLKKWGMAEISRPIPEVPEILPEDDIPF